MRKPKSGTVTVTQDNTKPMPIASASLKHLRDDITRQRLDIARTIADLDELSVEIAATLAFLKAQRDRK